MSYAEHGSRIFYTGRFNSNAVLKYGDYIVPRKRSEGRLKLFGSCTDLRAWSPNPLDNCRYFKEVVENPVPQGKIVPYDVMIESLKLLDRQTQKELVSLRQELEKYKSLRLSPEQKKQLQDIDDYSLGDRNKSEDYTSLQESQSTDEETAVPERPGTPEHSICSSSSNYDSESVNRSRIDDESSSEYRYEEHKPVSTSKSDSNECIDQSEENRMRADNDCHQEIIIEKDSEIIALKNELGAKDVELEELKDFTRNLETMLKKKEATLDTLRANLNISQQNIIALREQLNKSMEESNKKLYDNKCLVDHLKSSLAEKSQECTTHTREIEDLLKRIKESEKIREERDCLVRTLEEIIDERNTLRELNREQAMKLADQDDEINKLIGLLKLKTAEHSDREMKMMRKLDDLRHEIQYKESEISRFEADRRVSSQKQFFDYKSLSEMANLDIRKMRCALLDDLQELDNEIKRRCTEGHHKHSFREDETQTTWKHDKELLEYTNDQLKTMQVSNGNTRNEEEKDDEVYKRIVSQTSGSFEKIQQLIVELEPYQQERLTLIEKINSLTESLEKAKKYADEFQGAKAKEECDSKGQIILLSETPNKVIDAKKKNEKMNKRRNYEERIRLVQQKLDEKIDRALVVHVKRSIERVEEISRSLEGAGDNVSREMCRKEKELEARNEEIAKLRLQVASRVSRGQGDHAEQQEYSNELIRVKNELSTTSRSRDRMRDQLQSSDFKLKGATQKIKNLGAEIERLTKENKGLNNTVLITNDLAIKVDEMEIRLDSLQEENSELRRRILRANELCAEYQKKLMDLRDEGMQAKEAFERAESKLQSLLLGRDHKIEILREQKETAKRELEESNLKIAKLTEQIQSLRMQNKNLDYLEALIKEILKLDKNAKRLRTNIESMKSRLDDQRRVNDQIEEDLNLILGENETLQNETQKLRENIEIDTSNSIIATAVAKQSEIDELKAKSLEDSSVIENLRRDIQFFNNKAAEQEKIIIALEEANTDLRKKMEELQRQTEAAVQESASRISSENILAKAKKYLEAEIREKDERIEKLAHEIEATKEECRALSEKVQFLTSENTEISEKLRIEKVTSQKKMTDLQQQYKQQVKAIHDKYNVNVRRLEAKYEEALQNNGIHFDPEKWLESLTTKEMADLHKRISKSTPCDASKLTRALNDKHNQHLQEDGKMIHPELDNLKIGHHKERPSGYPPYIYERRKFTKPTETPVKDNATFDCEQRTVNFIHQCAMDHSSND